MNLKDVYNKQNQKQQQEYKNYKKKQQTNSRIKMGLGFLLVIGIIVGIIVFYLSGTENHRIAFSNQYGPYTTINIVDGNNVNIHGGDEDTDEIIIFYYDTRLDSNSRYEITVSDETINIINESQKETGAVDITVPLNLVLNIKASITNGNLIISDLDTNKITVDLDNGDLSLYSIYANEDVNVKTTNGDVNINVGDLISTNNVITSENGEIDIRDTLVNNLQAKNNNGSIYVELFYKGSETTNPYKVTATSKNGYVEQDINNDENQNVEVKLESENGNIVVSFLSE